MTRRLDDGRARTGWRTISVIPRREVGLSRTRSLPPQTPPHGSGRLFLDDAPARDGQQVGDLALERGSVAGSDTPHARDEQDFVAEVVDRLRVLLELSELAEPFLLEPHAPVPSAVDGIEAQSDELWRCRDLEFVRDQSEDRFVGRRLRTTRAREMPAAGQRTAIRSTMARREEGRSSIGWRTTSPGIPSRAARYAPVSG